MSTGRTGKRRRCDETKTETLVNTEKIHEIINAQTTALKETLLQEILEQNERCVCVCVCARVCVCVCVCYVCVHFEGFPRNLLFSTFYSESSIRPYICKLYTVLLSN